MRLIESVNRKLEFSKNIACVFRGCKLQDCEPSVCTNGGRALAYIYTVGLVHPFRACFMDSGSRIRRGFLLVGICYPRLGRP